jgi:hypothetical protein
MLSEPLVEEGSFIVHQRQLRGSGDIARDAVPQLLDQLEARCDIELE